MLHSILAVAAGSVLGGLFRWGLSLKLNPLLPMLPPGTLAANLIAGYVAGLAVAWFTQVPGIAPEWRLLLITGFCGGLSTFSTFSLEVAALLQLGRPAWAVAVIGVHVAGSLLMTFAGIATCHWIWAR
jgi:CrcB protein